MIHKYKEDQHCSQRLVPLGYKMSTSNTYRDNLYILAEISAPRIRRRIASMKERKRQVEEKRHPLFNHVPAAN